MGSTQSKLQDWMEELEALPSVMIPVQVVLAKLEDILEEE